MNIIDFKNYYKSKLALQLGVMPFSVKSVLRATTVLFQLPLYTVPLVVIEIQPLGRSAKTEQTYKPPDPISCPNSTSYDVTDQSSSST